MEDKQRTTSIPGTVLGESGDGRPEVEIVCPFCDTKQVYRMYPPAAGVECKECSRVLRILCRR